MICLKDCGRFPAYYHWASQAEPTVDYYDYGPQNSRGLRDLKVWLALRQVGRAGYMEMIADDIQLAQELYRLVDAQPELQAFTQGLSITTFRYVPPDLAPGSETVEAYLNQLNAEVLTRLQKSGEAVVSNAVIGGTFLLRACVVNFRTCLEDIEALPGMVIRLQRCSKRLSPAKMCFADPKRLVLQSILSLGSMFLRTAVGREVDAAIRPAGLKIE